MNKNEDVKIKWALKCCRTCQHFYGLKWCKTDNFSVDYFNVCPLYKAEKIKKVR